MMNKLWLVLFLALIGSRIGQGLPVGSSPKTYPQSPQPNYWDGTGFGALLGVAVVITVAALLFGCTWCLRHKDCKTNEGADNQLFTTSATHLHEPPRVQQEPTYSDPVNNNISEDNNNGPISLREMQNIANNNAAAYIVSENEERNRSRESVVEFLPLPAAIGAVDPLARCADWFAGESFPRSRLQYLREIGRGWFGRVVEGEIEEEGGTSNVAVKLLNQNASLEDKARFLDEARMYRDMTHENILAFVAKCLEEDPWILMFEFCSMDLQQYLVTNRPKMAILNESGVPLRLMCDVAAGLVHLHARGYLYRHVSSNHILVRDPENNPRAVLGHYTADVLDNQQQYNTSSEVWLLGNLLWEVCAWGATPAHHPPRAPDLPCPYRNHLYQIMQLCWQTEVEQRPSAAQVLALLSHLHASHTEVNDPTHDHDHFERRWQRLKPNTIPKLDEHIAIVHAPSSELTLSDYDQPSTVRDSLSLDAGVSRSSSIMSDKDPLSVKIKSESLTNLHGSLEDVRNIYLTHNETPALECHQGNINFEEKEDKSDSSMDPWLKEIIAGSHDDVSYYKDVSDVMKNLDNILNSEKTSSSESSHQASPSRENLSLDCKREYSMQSSLVKSPGITNFQNILDGTDWNDENETCEDDEQDKDTIGTLSHSFERHSESPSQHTLANLTPDTPSKDIEICHEIEQAQSTNKDLNELDIIVNVETQLPKEKETISSDLPKLQELCEISLNSVSVVNSKKNQTKKDCDSTIQESKSVGNNVTTQSEQLLESVDNKSQNLELNNYENRDNHITLPKESVEQKQDNQNEVKSRINNNDSLFSHDFIQNEKRFLESAASIKPNTETKSESETVNRVKREVLVFEENQDCQSDNQHREKDKEHGTLHLFENHNSQVTHTQVLSPESPTNVYGDVNKIAHFHILVETMKEIETNFNPTTDISKNLTTPIVVSPPFTQIQHDKVRDVPDHIKAEAKNIVDEVTVAAVFAINSEVRKEGNVTIPDSFLGREEIEPEQKSTENVLLVRDSNILENEVLVEISKNITDSKSKNLVNELENKNVDLINESHKIKQQIPENESILSLATEMPDTVQREENIGKYYCKEQRSDDDKDETLKASNNKEEFMDLINNTTSEIQDNTIHQNVINDCLGGSEGCLTLVKDESTQYLDLPADAITPSRTKVESFDDLLGTSTPKDNSYTVEIVPEATELIDGVVMRRLEQKYIVETSPPDSPTKSHQTDTYEDNSSVVLGPFESFSFAGYPTKALGEAVDLPKEELLAFSSNFSEMNLETPSPLRDVNFLIEVPDIPEDLHFDDIETISEVKKEKNLVVPSGSSSSQDVTDSQATEKNAPPSTPPNSPGIFLVSTPQPKYLVDIDLNPPSQDNFNHLQNEIELNQIELQITSKLAMAENENNMNIEYSGPLLEDGVEPDSLLLYDEDAGPERYLAGNLGSLEEPSEEVTLDEKNVEALRNELELKLPFAQVASIKPQPEGEWAEALPPPELIVNYPGALSPIQEETRQQLSAYENDAQWLPSVRTDSSESYPEPCNNSTDEVTDLNESGLNDTFIMQSRSDHNTYTVDKDASSSKRLTMSSDSLNGSPHEDNDPKSPVDEKTYTKADDDLNCERISQVSPFLLSPTTDTSAPGNSTDNATALSTLMKTTVPTDAKFSKPSDTQCLSKATSIDSCCSNDTLYNVEENFDDMALDPDLPAEFDKGDFRERRHSCGSTYTIQDSKSEVCETFSPDSITENNYTYTNLPRTDIATTTPTATKSDNNTEKNTTNDLAYGTLPSYSNCATEYLSGVDDNWKIAQPELIRKSPLPTEMETTPPKFHEHKIQTSESPQTKFEPSVKKMDSVEITCLQDNLYSFNKSDTPVHETSAEVKDSPEHHTSTAPFITSTPVTEENNETVEGTPNTPDTKNEIPEKLNLQQFQQNSEVEDISSIGNIAFVNSTAFLDDLSRMQPSLNDETTVEKTSTYSDFEKSALSKPQSVPTRETSQPSDGSSNTLIPSYSDFEKSALSKPQYVPTDDKSNRSEESGITSEDFLTSVQFCPQDLSSLIDASSMLLASERRFHSLNTDSIPASQSDSLGTESTQPLVSLFPNSSNFDESQMIRSLGQPDSLFFTDLEGDEEMDQPHSIIITGNPQTLLPENSNVTYDSHVNTRLLAFNNTFNSHESPQSGHDDKNTSEESTSLSKLIEHNTAKTEKSQIPQSDSLQKVPVANGPNSEETDNANADKIKVNNPEVAKVDPNEIKCNGTEVFATENFLSDAFEELVESNVDIGDVNDSDTKNDSKLDEISEIIAVSPNDSALSVDKENVAPNASVSNAKKTTNNAVEGKTVTEDFLQNEKKFCQLDSYIPLLGDIRFTGPATDIMTTSFSQDSPTSPNSPEGETNKRSSVASEIAKEWDSDTDSHSSNSSSGEFIWKDGEGRETSVVPSTRFDHQRDGQPPGTEPSAPADSGSGSSCSGSEGDEVEFVPSSWDCSAAPSKSSLRTLQHHNQVQDKKRVVFKRQKYHCVYEYPRENVDLEHDSPAAYLPDLSTYCEWDPASAEEAELGYGQLFGAPNPLDMFPLRAGISFGADYEDDFFISSSARPFEALGVMSAGSQFFPGKNRPHDDVTVAALPYPPAPLSPATLTFLTGKSPSLDFTTPDSGVEDITPGSTSTEEDYKKIPESDITSWKPADSGSSSESVSPSSPGGEALGGLRHTRDKLKLDLPPSPHAPSPRSPRHNRVFNFVLDKPKRHRYTEESPRLPEVGTTPLVMTDETPIVTTSLQIQDGADLPVPEPTFSTFGKTAQVKPDEENDIVLAEDNVKTDSEVKEEENHAKVETVKGEGTVLDSGDEDSGIESSKATLERQNKTPNIS